MNGALSAPYAMSKTAVEALGRALRVELAGTGVDVGVACFAFIDTQLVRDANDRPGIAQLRRSVPKFITRIVPVAGAGTAIADGVAARAVRVAAPKWMRLTLPLRGLIQYFDSRMVKDRNVRSAINAAENAEHD